MKYILIVLLLAGCGMTSSRQRQSQGQDQQQGQSQGQVQGQAHSDMSREMPIIIICNHVGTGSSECIRRSTPFNDTQELMK